MLDQQRMLGDDGEARVAQAASDGTFVLAHVADRVIVEPRMQGHGRVSEQGGQGAMDAWDAASPPVVAPRAL